MARVKLLVARAGTGFAQSAGDEVEVSADEAVRMVAAGQAVALEDEPERAVRRRPAQKAVR